jgi:hypothetical protein
MGQTATQKLNYPDSGDQLKQQAQFLETLAKQIDARGRSHSDSLDIASRPPMAIADISVQRTYATDSTSVTPTDSLFILDSVAVDTRGIVDLTSDPHFFNLSESGYWLVGAYVDFFGTPGGSGCTTGGIKLSLDFAGTTPNGLSNFVHDSQVANHVALHSSGLIQVDNSLIPMPMSVFADNSGTGCAATLTVSSGRVWAVKVRDL